MSKERRTNPRRSIHQLGLIVRIDESIVSECTIRDVSATGAQLNLKMPDNVPDEFDLLLSKRARVSRRCEVVWRSKDRIGARFLSPRKE